jgi:hypothetical protein
MQKSLRLFFLRPPHWNLHFDSPIRGVNDDFFRFLLSSSVVGGINGFFFGLSLRQSLGRVFDLPALPGLADVQIFWRRHFEKGFNSISPPDPILVVLDESATCMSPEMDESWFSSISGKAASRAHDFSIQ